MAACRGPDLPTLIVAATAAAMAGVVLYFHSPAGARRGLGLGAGLASVVLIGVYSEVAWDFRVYYALRGPADTPQQILLRWGIVTLISGVLLLAPQLFRRRASQRA
jgi:hypothetical protein